MRQRKINLALVAAAFLLAGLSQYALSAWRIMQTGQVTIEVLGFDDRSSAGFLRYIKDLIVIIWGLIWPLISRRNRPSRRLVSLFHLYFGWLTVVLISGTLPFVIGLSPLFFLPSGIRWLLLLHACIGILFLSASSSITEHQQRRLQLILFMAVVIDLIFLARQLLSAGFQSFSFGAVRLTGLFSHAGVAGAFAFAIAIIASQIEVGRLRWRAMLLCGCIFIALGAGSRSGVLLIAGLLLWSSYKASKASYQANTELRRIAVGAIAVFVVAYGYPKMIATVGRGNMFAQQLENGGRAANLVDALGTLVDADLTEFLIGRGLGIGTNTAIGQLSGLGVDPSTYRFNLLVDNAFITTFYQLGFIGSLIFWTGIFLGMLNIPSRTCVQSKNYKLIIILFSLNALSTSVFESYFVMLGTFIALGVLAAKSMPQAQLASRSGILVGVR